MTGRRIRPRTPRSHADTRRVLAIGIRQLSPREVAGNLGTVAGRAVTQPIPVTDVPVFTGTTGSNLMKTMLPFLKQQMGV